jgi:hypothetical protein
MLLVTQIGNFVVHRQGRVSQRRTWKLPPHLQPPLTNLAGHAWSNRRHLFPPLAALAKSNFIPKGVYRFKTHEAMNKHQEDCLARGMGLLAIERARDRTNNPSGDT